MKWGSTTTLPHVFNVQCANSVDITLFFILLCKQMGCYYEKIKRGIGIHHPGRSICIAIIALLIFNTASVYAASEVIIVAGTGSGISQFADYNSNTTVANSYIVVDSNVPFSNAFNALSRNIAKLTSTAASSNLYINTTNSYIATLYTYLSNNLPGQWQTLSDIKTNTANSAAADQAALTFLGSLENLQLKEAYNSTVLYDSRYSERYIRPGINCSVSLSNGEFQLTNFNGTYPAQSTFTIPMYQNQYTFVRFEIYTPKVLTIQPLIYGNISDSFIVPSNSWITITSYKQPDFYGSNSGGFYISDSTLTSSDVVKIRNVQYISSPDLDTLSKTNSGLSNLKSDTSDILDAINNLSLTNNDIKVTVNYTNNDAQNVQDIIPFIRNFFDNNISVNDFVNEASNGQSDWFSQTNKDLMENLSGGYVDLYD